MQAKIRYRVEAIPQSRLFRVELSVSGPDPEGQRLSLPAWIPGSYMIRDFARNIVSLEATTGEGDPVPVEKQDKQRWLTGPVSGALVLKYDVYAADLSVRGAYLDNTRGYFNGTNLFLRVAGQENAPVQVEIKKPDAEDCQNWKLATTMPAVSVDKKGFGNYGAADYDSLIDYPVEMAEYQSLEFSVHDVPHQMVVSGRVTYDSERLAADLEKICACHASLFGELPVDRYLFLTLAVADGYGGLEHRDSTSLICKKDDLPSKGMKQPSEEYRDFLGLCSHEYFHLWNVKRIRPEILKQADLSKEAHTRLLWAFEGITSYYDELALVRSGCIEANSYLQLLARTVTRVMRGKGRHKQSIAESSFDAWTRFYKQDENSPNAIVSYYAKGALVALGLDVTIRKKTNDVLSLDNLMRLMWQKHGVPDLGVTEDGIEALVAELTGIRLNEFFDSYVTGTTELPLAEWFAYLGIGYRLRPAENSEDRGGMELPLRELPPRPVIGARFQQQGDFVELTHVVEGGAAQAAGLAATDKIVAVNDLQVTAKNLPEKIGSIEPGSELEVLAFRRDELMRFTLNPNLAEDDTCDLWLSADDECTPEQLDRRSSWLWLG